jgi:very-short-patch-repair endonuclease
MLIVEIDGGYHDDVVEHDLKRQKQFESSLGWKVLRFSDKDVEADAAAVTCAIAKEEEVNDSRGLYHPPGRVKFATQCMEFPKNRA